MKMSVARARAALKKMPQAKRNKLGIKSHEDVSLLSESRLNSIMSDSSFESYSDNSSSSSSSDFSSGGGDFGGGGASGDW